MLATTQRTVFVSQCFFVGNDFLPHLPSLDIREGAIDMLFALYKLSLPSLGGFLTMDGGALLQPSAAPLPVDHAFSVVYRCGFKPC